MTSVKIKYTKNAFIKLIIFEKNKFIFVANGYKELNFEKIVTKLMMIFARNTDVYYIWRELQLKGVLILF
ncbi:hypothetical protein [uncultured Clostridium sp.]|uniref:hypothetical protein n=1 Tax=uncultured Clostridium sp. TaxID=59620 RepID=UPI0025E0B0B7|nr:hypothetical protein [uncultured Clostridium sp.]